MTRKEVLKRIESKLEKENFKDISAFTFDCTERLTDERHKVGGTTYGQGLYVLEMLEANLERIIESMPESMPIDDIFNTIFESAKEKAKKKRQRTQMIDIEKILTELNEFFK